MRSTTAKRYLGLKPLCMGLPEITTFMNREIQYSDVKDLLQTSDPGNRASLTQPPLPSKLALIHEKYNSLIVPSGLGTVLTLFIYWPAPCLLQALIDTYDFRKFPRSLIN